MSPSNSTDPVLWSVDARGVATVVLNRPEVNNAYDGSLVEGLLAAEDALAAASGLRAVVVKGNGRHFQAGADLKWLEAVRTSSPQENLRASRATAEAVRRLNRTPVPTIALVHGGCFGGGTGLIAACDVVIAADNAVFGQTGPRVGSWDGGFGASLLRDLVGTKKAKEFWLLCRQYDAATALNWGLVNAVVPLEKLEEETVNWCRDMLKLSPMALRMIKAGFNADTDGLSGIQELAGNATSLFYMSEEGQEGRNAWLERRPPNFSKYRKRP